MNFNLKSKFHFRFSFFFILILSGWNLPVVAKSSLLSERLHIFADLPDGDLNEPPCLPTLNDRIFKSDLEGFAAKTRTNEDYGRPGWTRGEGTRFHKGVDILPLSFEKTSSTVRINYYDPKTGRNFSKNESVLIPKDKIFAILDGKVVVANTSEKRSGYGRYLMIEHHFANGQPFISMYAHLEKLEVREGEKIKKGTLIGQMGRTSSNPGGRTYLKAIPHCHFEVGKLIDLNFSKTKTARMLYPPILGGNYDPRNIQPYHPVEFLRKYRAQVVSTNLASKTLPAPTAPLLDSKKINLNPSRSTSTP